MVVGELAEPGEELRLPPHGTGRPAAQSGQNNGEDSLDGLSCLEYSGGFGH